MDLRFGSSAAAHLQQHREPEHDEPGGEEQRHHAGHARDGQLQQRHKSDHQQTRDDQKDLRAGGEGREGGYERNTTLGPGDWARGVSGEMAVYRT